MKLNFSIQSLNDNTPQDFKDRESFWRAHYIAFAKMFTKFLAKQPPAYVTDWHWRDLLEYVDQSNEKYEGLNLFLRVDPKDCMKVTNFDVHLVGINQIVCLSECLPWKDPSDGQLYIRPKGKWNVFTINSFTGGLRMFFVKKGAMRRGHALGQQEWRDRVRDELLQLTGSRSE
jgi:hypothetical protein